MSADTFHSLPGDITLSCFCLRSRDISFHDVLSNSGEFCIIFSYFLLSSESSIMIMVGFMPELLAWDSLRQLMLLLDKAVEVRFCST